MKKNYFINSLLSVLILLSISARATVHMVDVANFSFTPDTMTVIVGDTVQWMWISGTHTTTSTSVPAGAATWNNSINSSISFFNYKVTVAGVYNYDCAIHTFMTGTFTATDPSGIASISTEPTFTWSMVNDEVTMQMNFNSATALSIHLFNLLGANVRTLGSLQNVVGTYNETFSLSGVPKGIYFLEVIAENRKIVRKIIVD
jgi:plastocyanin